jgi:hypothetical protein
VQKLLFYIFEKVGGTTEKNADKVMKEYFSALGTLRSHLHNSRRKT